MPIGEFESSTPETSKIPSPDLPILLSRCFGGMTEFHLAPNLL